MKRTTKRLALVLTAAFAAAVFAFANGPATDHASSARERSELAGRYRLQGVREVGAELELREDGRFAYAIAYGGVDARAEGAWTTRAGMVSLKTDRAPPPSVKWGEALGTFDLPASAEADHPPLLLVVKVISPELGLSWSNAEVTAEFSNGKTRSGLTAQDGRLAFLARTEPEWQGATIRRVAVALPKADVRQTWFPIDPATTRTAVVHFLPGSAIQPAFEHLELLVQHDSMRGVELIDKSSDPQRAVRYVR